MATALKTKLDTVFILFNTCPNTDEHPSHAYFKLDLETGKQILQRMLYAQKTAKLFGTALDHIRFCDWGATYFDNTNSVLEDANAEELGRGGDAVAVESFELPEEDEHRIAASYMVCDANHFWFEATDDSADEPFMTVFFDLKFLIEQMLYMGWDERFEDIHGDYPSVAILSY